jgi:polyisoprenoid-binding protein YceI
MKTYWLMGMSAALLLTAGAGRVGAEEVAYHFGVSDQRTNISFESQTDFEHILGSTNQLTGKVRVDWETGTAKLNLTVPVASMKTGIDLRDEHLRSPGWLDEEKYPEIEFKADKISSLGENKYKVEGTFTMHGVSKALVVEADVRQIPSEAAQKAGLEKGDWIRVSTSFKVKLSDYGVTIPEMAAAKVNNAWKVRIQAFASTAKP